MLVPTTTLSWCDFPQTSHVVTRFLSHYRSESPRTPPAHLLNHIQRIGAEEDLRAAEEFFLYLDDLATTNVVGDDESEPVIKVPTGILGVLFLCVWGPSHG